MSLRSEERAQASIELLLLVGGAIMIAAVVGLYLKRAAQAASEGAQAKGEEVIGT